MRIRMKKKKRLNCALLHFAVDYHILFQHEKVLIMWLTLSKISCSINHIPCATIIYSCLAGPTADLHNSCYCNKLHNIYCTATHTHSIIHSGSSKYHTYSINSKGVKLQFTKGQNQNPGQSRGRTQNV